MLSRWFEAKLLIVMCFLQVSLQVNFVTSVFGFYFEGQQQSVFFVLTSECHSKVYDITCDTSEEGRALAQTVKAHHLISAAAETLYTKSGTDPV